MIASNQDIADFKEALWQHYAHHARRSLSWRQPEPDGSFSPYKIMVSEVMLQQTQVGRVIPKFEAFISSFPNVSALARTELGEVLRAWQGLGYNRRAKFLWQAAQTVDSRRYFPRTLAELVKLPGIGVNTAGAILAYAFNLPAVFIETNVRTVYIHHFFQNEADISDTDIRDLLERTVDPEHPREFYWALMDYGSHLKATRGNLNKLSKHYAKQSGFDGSRRQIRGQVIHLLSIGPKTLSELKNMVPDERLEVVLRELSEEQLVKRGGSTYSL